MTKQEVINKLHSINFVCTNEKDDNDRKAFEPLILADANVGLECLQQWQSKYYTSFKSRAMIEYYEIAPTWENFHNASHYLMLDRIIAAVEMEGNVTSNVKGCIDQTLKCGNIDLTTVTWIEYYSGATTQERAA